MKTYKILVILGIFSINSLAYAQDIFDKVPATIKNSSNNSNNNGPKKCELVGRVIKCSGPGTIIKDGNGNTLGNIDVGSNGVNIGSNGGNNSNTTNSNTNNTNGLGNPPAVGFTPVFIQQRTPFIAGLDSNRSYLYLPANLSNNSLCLNNRPTNQKFWVRGLNLAAKVTESVDNLDIEPNEIISYEFTIPNEFTNKTVNLFLTQGNFSRIEGWTINLSEAPCDFIESSVNNGNNPLCYSSGYNVESGLTFLVNPDSNFTHKNICNAVVGKRYYLNIKIPEEKGTMADRCQLDRDYWGKTFNCGGIIKFTSH